MACFFFGLVELGIYPISSLYVGLGICRQQARGRNLIATAWWSPRLRITYGFKSTRSIGSALAATGTSAEYSNFGSSNQIGFSLVPS